MSSRDGSGGVGDKRVAELLEKLRRAATATSADRSARDQMLDELQEAVGLSGKMVTERDIIRKAEELIRAG